MTISNPMEIERPDPRTAPLTASERKRYSRHLILPEVGAEGQKRLRNSRVLLIGAGGLGAPAALYLTAAGVGEIGVIDFDTVDESNLQRQVLYGTSDVGRSKLSAARARLEDLNPGVRILPFEERLEASNAERLLAGFDVVVDGADNFPTRYLVNDTCVKLGIPNVHGSIYRFDGQVSVFDAQRGPCYRCIYPQPPPPGVVPSCAEGGVLGVLPGVIGTLQAVETLKLLLGIGEPLIGRLLHFDALELRFRELALRKDPDCPLCGPNPRPEELLEAIASCEIEGPVPTIGPEELAGELRSASPPLLIDVREPEEWAVARLPTAILLPTAEFSARIDQLREAKEIVVYCRSGRRSATALRSLRDLGFANVRSLEGGIVAWTERVDPSLPPC